MDKELFIALSAEPVTTIGVGGAMRQMRGFEQSPAADDAVIACPSAFDESVLRCVGGQRKIERDLSGFKMFGDIARKPDFLTPVPRAALVVGHNGVNVFCIPPSSIHLHPLPAQTTKPIAY